MLNLFTTHRFLLAIGKQNNIYLKKSMNMLCLDCQKILKNYIVKRHIDK